MTEDIKQKWGDNYTLEKYAYFESALKGLMAIKGATTSLEVERYTQKLHFKEKKKAYKTVSFNQFLAL